MGGLCSREEAMDDIVTTELKPDGTAVENRRAISKDSKLFIRKTKTMLSVIIPELKRILHDKEEVDMLRQIIAVLDKVAYHYHEEYSPEERQKLLMLCVPERETRFKALLETFKAGEKIRQSRADVDLMRIIRLWFESDEDNSGELEMNEVGQLLNTLGISINQRDLKALFNKVDTSGDGSVQFDEFYQLYTDATTIAVIREIFSGLSTRRPGTMPIFVDDGRQVHDLHIDPNAYRPQERQDVDDALAEQAAQQAADHGEAKVQDQALGDLAALPSSPGFGDGRTPPPLPNMEGASGGGRTPPTGTTPGATVLSPDGKSITPPPGSAGQQNLTPAGRTPGTQTPSTNQPLGAAAAEAAAPMDEKERQRLEKEEEKERKRREKEEKKNAKKKKKEEPEEAEEPEVQVLSFHDCHRFLREVQQMDFDADAAVFVVANFFGEMRVIEDVTGVAPRQFQNSLVDPVRNSWMNPKEELVTQDMSQPLSHYFIDSSFKTYLTGNQLSSPPSAEMFREALREGCRYVEMDVWNGPDGRPIVCLGQGAGRTCTFEECVSSIAENAWYHSPFPVIIALEIQVDEDQQVVMVDMMKSYFGDAMIMASDMEKTQLSSPAFSPVKLMRKFLIKTKKIAELVIEQALDEEQLDADKVATMAQKAQRGSAMSQVCAIEQRRFRSLGACKKWPHYSLVSFDETKMEQMVEKEMLEEVAEISKTLFIRSSPKGLRYDSSNQNPMLSWQQGAQIATMNYQTLDYGFRLNRAKFSINGHCGYVLKPRCLRLPGVAPNVYGDRKRLTVEIVCGVQLPRSLKVKRGETEIPDPYIELWITGVPDDDTAHRTCKTKWIENNTFNPRWGETFTFVINSVEMAILTVRVMDRDINAVIAEGVCPVAGLRMGYRAVPLVAENGTAIPPPSCLFARFDMEEIGTRVDESDL